MADATQKKRRNSYHGKYIKSIVWGGLDGIVTTFVVVAGVTGASLSSGILIILGLGSLLGDAVSMGIGDYAGSHAEKEYHEAEQQHLGWIYDNSPEQEQARIVEIYKDKGLSGQDAQTVASILSKKKETAVELMMLAEHGALEVHESPVTQGLYTFCSFILFGSVPLSTYIMAPLFPRIADYRFIIACVLTGITLFLLGAFKVCVSKRNWFLSGLEMVGIGSISSILAYLIGYGLAGLA